MKPKEILVFGGSGQIGRHLLRKLTRKNFRVTVVTRNIHRKGYVLKSSGNAGFCITRQVGGSSGMQNIPTGRGNNFHTRKHHISERLLFWGRTF